MRAESTVKDMLDALGIPASTISTRSLVYHAEADELVVAETSQDGREHRLIPAAAAAWSDMKHAAASDGISIIIVSAFRTHDRQYGIVKRKLDHGQSLEAILHVSAPPGYSEHHSGRAVDVGTDGDMTLEASFAGTPAHAWLVRHAQEYGFHLTYPPGNPWGFAHEPWHWCYRLDTMAR